jgi:hypothetical protein
VPACIKSCACCFLPCTHPTPGKTVKCADVNGELKSTYAESYKTCADKEVLQGGSTGSTGGASPQWAQMSNMDVAGKDIPSNGKSFTEVSTCMAVSRCRIILPFSDDHCAAQRAQQIWTKASIIIH